MANALSLEQLDDDTLRLILALQTPSTLLAVAGTCSSLRSAALDAELWRTHYDARFHVCDAGEVWRGVPLSEFEPHVAYRRAWHDRQARLSDVLRPLAPGPSLAVCRSPRGRDSPRLQIAIAICSSSRDPAEKAAELVTSVVDALCRELEAGELSHEDVADWLCRSCEPVMQLAALGALRARAGVGAAAGEWRGVLVSEGAFAPSLLPPRPALTRALAARVDVMVHAFSQRRDCRGFRARDDLTTLSEPLGVLAASPQHQLWEVLDRGAVNEVRHIGVIGRRA